MAYVQGAWTFQSINNRMVWKCTLTATTSETDSVTAKTLDNLDPTRSWILIVNAEGTDVSDGTDPVDIYAGYSKTFTSTSEGGAATVTGGNVVAASVMDGVSDEALVTIVDPNYTGAVVQAITGTVGHVNAGTAPNYIINVNGGGARKAADTVFYIIQ